MDLDPTPDQALLLETSARFVADTFPLERVRAFADGAPADPALMAGAADLGWFAMFVDEEHGGGSVSGDAVADAVLVAQLRGATLQPEPFVATNAVAAVLSRFGSDAVRAAVLPDLAAGKATATRPVSGPPLAVRADGADLLLSGSVVVDDPDATWLLAAAHVDDAVVPLLLPLDTVPTESRTRLACLDLTRRLDALSIDRLRVPREALIGAPSAVSYGASVAALLSVAESVGAMDRLFALTRQYALDRIAFGRPIGSFQAVKHLLADVSLVVESAKAVLAAAARAVSGDEAYAAEAVSIAKVHVGSRAARFGQDCLQVFGGIGFAWEHDLHLYLRRLTTDAALHGSVDDHRHRILAAHTTELLESA